LRIEVFVDPAEVARKAADFVASEALTAVSERGRFVMALSGGSTPWKMLRDLAETGMPWKYVYVVQVDERVAPAGHPDRNLTHLRESLLQHPGLLPERIYPMPVAERDLEAAAARYARDLQEIAGIPPVLDLVHLGLGKDGHTASLIPGDQVLEVSDADVASTGLYEGRRRMTLTYPVIDRSRRILWLVTGAEKAATLRRLREADPSIPAGRVEQGRAIIFADQEAAGGPEAGGT
jgi:6-phosphogluconolactonase